MDRISTKGQMIDQIDLRGVPHSGFDRSNHNYGTCKLGTIVPVRLDEVYPGDRIKAKPEVVANFEPLAQPLMGSMVLKQESFFVPYIQLWRHAYKFFTGKNGFSEVMPTISPFGIFDIYWRSWMTRVFGTIGSNDLEEYFGLGVVTHCVGLYHENAATPVGYSSFNSEHYSLQQHLIYQINESYSRALNYYESRKMVDLIQPAFDILRRFANSAFVEDLSIKMQANGTSAQTRADYTSSFALALGNVVKEFFNYFFGPSSIFDYLGWPVPLQDDFKWTVAGTQITNLFQFFCWVACSDGSVGYTIYDKLSDLFSKVPLNFAPFKAYYLVWYWNYRDQLLETDILDPDEDEFLGSTITENMVYYCTILRQRCWFKDTFTTALTNTGDGNLVVPITNNSVDVKFYDSEDQLINTTDYNAALNAGATRFSVSSGGIEYNIPMNYLHGSFSSVYSSQDSQYYDAISLDLFDRVRRLRSFVQKRLVLGYEVDDVVYSSFMVRMSDVRLRYPEILGRGRDAVQLNTLVNNTSTNEQIAGDRTAIAYAHGQHSEINYFSEDWGLFLTFMTVQPIQCYAGGMQRLYLKKDSFDFMWPDFATMGMDAVYNCELAALGTRLTDEQGLMVFGYQGRYYDLKSRLDEEHGRLLTDLNFLTFSREWNKDNPPKLNYQFVHCWPRLDGFVIEDPTVDIVRYDFYNAHGWERRLPVPSEYIS